MFSKIFSKRNILFSNSWCIYIDLYQKTQFERYRLLGELVVVAHIFYMAQWSVTTCTSPSKHISLLFGEKDCLVQVKICISSAYHLTLLWEFGLAFSKLFPISVFKFSIINKSFWLMKHEYVVMWFMGHVTYSYI